MKRCSGRNQTISGAANRLAGADAHKIKLNICTRGGIGRRAWFCSRLLGEKLLNSV
ncbi:MAG: hypothetical protein IKJ06_03390 [Clostridia bacterium]|nr:hypothetical protein [Clostridia bacterium]